MLRFVTQRDIDQWMQLAKEVEPLFGKLVGNEDFKEGIKSCVYHLCALCIEHSDQDIAGIIAIDKEKNEICWLAVKNEYRGYGYGRQLLAAAIDCLDTKRPIYVQTFSAQTSAGIAARNLYLQFGFKDDRCGGKNPAGIDTVIMIRKESDEN
jgi:GNAT superfamily N-acetyltransferase